MGLPLRTSYLCKANRPRTSTGRSILHDYVHNRGLRLKRGNSNVAVIVPTRNEEQDIGRVLRELRHVLGDPFLMVVDGNSVDDTVQRARQSGALIIRQKDKGKGSGLRQAFEYDGLNNSHVVIMDADGSMDPKEVPSFIRALESGADVVKGSRFLGNGHSTDLTLIRRIGNKILVSLVNLIWSTDYTDLCYGFMAFRRQSLRKLSPLLDSMNFEIETEICIKAKKLGLEVAEIPSVELRRLHGRSNLSTFRDGLKILREIVTESLTDT